MERHERLQKDLIHFLQADVTYLFSHDKWECYIFEDDGVAYYAIITDDCGGTGKMCVKKIDKSLAVEEIIECMQYTDEGASSQLRMKDKEFEIVYVINGWGLKNGYVAFSIREVAAMREEANDER